MYIKQSRLANRTSGGFSMMEVLVSVLIFSIGMLGLAGLQGTALRSTNSANFKSKSNELAQEMLEYIRANRTEALKSGSTTYTLALGSASDNSSPAAPKDANDATINCNTVKCNAATIAQHQLHDWWTDAQKFPSGDASVSIDRATGIATVTIKWDDQRTGNIHPDCPANTPVKYACYKISAKI